VVPGPNARLEEAPLILRYHMGGGGLSTSDARRKRESRRNLDAPRRISDPRSWDCDARRSRVGMSAASEFPRRDNTDARRNRNLDPDARVEVDPECVSGRKMNSDARRDHSDVRRSRVGM